MRPKVTPSLLLYLVSASFRLKALDFSQTPCLLFSAADLKKVYVFQIRLLEPKLSYWLVKQPG